MKIHMVKKGDTLYQIAQKYNVDLDTLIALNTQIADPNVIDVGMKVKIPSTPKPVEPPTDYLYKHIVMQGDTLWKLGKAWNVPLNDMIEANPQLKNPSVLMTGETVYIPKAKPQSGHHSSHHPYQGGHGHKKNTAPIETAPPVPMPMPVETYPQVNVPNAEAGPAAESPYTPMPYPNLPNIPNVEMPYHAGPNMELPFHPGPSMEMPYNQGPTMEMPYNQGPNIEMPYNQGPNMEMPYNQGPNMEMPFNQGPTMEMPYNQGPNMEMPFNQGPTMEMPYNQGPNVPTPYTPYSMEAPTADVNQNQPVYVSPFSEQVPDLMPEVPSNIPNAPAQKPASDLFKQFQVPATEVLSHNYNDVNQVAWNEPAAPSFPVMPSAEHMPFGAYPANAYPTFGPSMHEADCGCGAPQIPGYNQPIPYPLGAHAEMPNMGYHPHTGYPEMMHPGFGYPGMPMTMPMSEQPHYSHGYDPLAMTSAYPGSMYPSHAYPMGYPYAGAGYHDCGCDDKSRGNEQEEREFSQGAASNQSGAKESAQSSGNNKRKTRPVQTASTRSSKRTNSRIPSSKPKSKRSPWINV